MVALGARVLLRAVEVHLDQRAVLLVDEHLPLDVELLHLRQGDAHLALDLLHHEALVGEDLGAEEADRARDDLAEALQELRLPLDVLRLLPAVVEEGRVDELDLPRRRDLARHAHEADLLESHSVGVGEGQVVRAVGVPGARARDGVGHGGDDLRLGRGRHGLVRRRDDGAIEQSLAEPVAEDRGNHAAVLATRQDLGVLAAGSDDPPVAAEKPLIDPGLAREDGVPHVELTDAEAGADLGADIAPDALADTTEVERRRRLRHLLRLAVDVVDDIVGADEHAGAALAAAPIRHDLVHHLLEGRRLHESRHHIHQPFAVSIAGAPPP